ncbi:MAG: peptide chain release factor N(5)-glutamine methyltransferase [Flavobacteriales bacterium]
MNGILADNKADTLWRHILAALSARYDTRESEQIATELFRHYLGWNRAERIMRSSELLSESQLLATQQAAKRIRQGEPLQYVTGAAWFMGRPFRVDASVLIPRPETEELVSLASGFIKPGSSRILDIGAGSGCIAVSLSLAHPDAHITACDVSESALLTAQHNARALHANVDFIRCNVLVDFPGGEWDLIVSNPPYIPLSEADSLSEHVRRHEPPLALFVENESPVIFYERIALLLALQEKQDSMACCEIHPAFAGRMKQLGDLHNHHTELISDAQDNTRFVIWKKSMPLSA